MKIRKATKKDSERIKEIFKVEYAKPPFSEKWSEELTTKRIDNYFNDHEIFVLEIDKEVQGFVILSTYIWHTGLRGLIGEIVVSSEFQGHGYGKMLMNFAEEHLKREGAKEIQLMTSPESKVYQIYKKMGYKDEDFVSMYKELK